jgi:hypothetical protein
VPTLNVHRVEPVAQVKTRLSHWTRLEPAWSDSCCPTPTLLKQLPLQLSEPETLPPITFTQKLSFVVSGCDSDQTVPVQWKDAPSMRLSDMLTPQSVPMLAQPPLQPLKALSPTASAWMLALPPRS